MKKLKIKKSQLKNAVDITPMCEDCKIYRFGLDRYAIAFAEQELPIYAFKSDTFSKFINSLESPIIDFMASRSLCLCCDQICNEFILTMITENDRKVRFYDHDAIEECQTLVAEEREESPVSEAFKVFNLPKKDPYRRMLLSKPLLKELEPLIQKTSETTILSRLWQDFKRVDGGPFIDRSCKIKGEFIDFGATELLCGRVVFFSDAEREIAEFEETIYNREQS